ncbi:MAG: anhydro-N-acetylmuramic acid kinase [Planctomycetes bacterium]|nr:anhydro-N-acetylmuramic acid kinase [Planctomycetota bacterium]
MSHDRPRLILGMSSGTSADAIDMALVRIAGSGQQRHVVVECAAEQLFDSQLQADVHNFVVQYDQPLAHLDKKLAIFFGETVNKFLKKNNISATDIDCVASHGQTVFHHDGDPRQGSLQLGDLQTISNSCQQMVIGNFRQADLLAGGQGAPISVFADWVLHGNSSHDCAILNLGGIANLSYLRKSAAPIAYDCGPANAPLDAIMRSERGQVCDIDGKLAASGVVNDALLDELKGHPYFAKLPPKSTGLELFGRQWVDSIRDRYPQLSTADILATLCEVVTYGLSSSLTMSGLSPKQIYLCGGGRRNLALVASRRANLPHIEFLDYSELGFDADLREAVAFALLADAHILGETSTWPSTTGAKKSSVLGNVVHPCT